MKLSVFLVFLIFFFSLAYAQPNAICTRVFSENFKQASSESIGDSNEAWYVPTGSVIGNKNTRNLNQCATSECYLFAFLGSIEVQNETQRQSLNAPRFSGAYLFAQKMLLYAEDLLWKGPQKTSFSLKGGKFFDALNLSRVYGLMPEESWQPPVPFEQWDFVKIYNTLNKTGVEWSEYISSLAQKNGWKSKITSDAYQQGRQVLQNVIYDYSGKLPSEINFRNQTLSTKDIERQYGIDHRSRILMMYPEGTFRDNADTLKKKLDQVTLPFSGGWKYEGADWTKIETTMMKWIINGAPVVIDLKWNDTFHSMVVTDFEAENGKLKRWKVKNSWSESFGDRGYVWYSYQDVRKNLVRTWRIGYNKK